MARPEQLLAEGTPYVAPAGTRGHLRIENAATIELASGRLIVSDPTYFMSTDDVDVGLNYAFREGAVLDVSIITVEFHAGGERLRRGAGAMAVVRDSLPSDWRLLEPLAARRFAVDSGLGAFVDERSVTAVVDVVDDREKSELVFDSVAARGWCSLPRDGSDAGAVIFDCGVGDGAYDVWTGYSKGELCSVLCDLDLLAHLAPAQ